MEGETVERRVYVCPLKEKRFENHDRLLEPPPWELGTGGNLTEVGVLDADWYLDVGFEVGGGVGGIWVVEG